MLFTQKNVIEIQQVVFHCFTLHKICSSKNQKEQPSWSEMTQWCLFWLKDRQSPYKIIQAHSSRLMVVRIYIICQVWVISFAPHFSLTLSIEDGNFWATGLKECVVNLTFSNPCDISRQDRPLFSSCNLSLQSSYLNPLIHCGLKKKPLKQNALFGNKENHRLLALLINFSNA